MMRLLVSAIVSAERPTNGVRQSESVCYYPAFRTPKSNTFGPGAGDNGSAPSADHGNAARAFGICRVYIEKRAATVRERYGLATVHGETASLRSRLVENRRF